MSDRQREIEAFRREAHLVVDWMAQYLAGSESYPVLSPAAPGSIRSRLPPDPPLDGAGIEETIAEVERVVVPGLTHWNSPEFMAYFATTASPPGILGEMYTAVLNQNALVWQASPAIHEIEPVILDWLRQMIGLPEGLFGIIYDTASISTLCAIAAARDHAAPEITSKGYAEAPELRMYASAEAHSVVDKAAMVLGIGRDNVRKIPVDDAFRMRPDLLEDSIRADVSAGLRPFCVAATVGTTSTTSVDPVAEIAQVCDDHDLWLHVDAAYGGSAAILPEMRWVMEGCDRADSFCLNPHKWLFVPLDLSAFYTRRPQALRRSFRFVRPYLETDRDEMVDNLADYGPQLGRRFRGLKLWLVIRAYGVRGLQATIRRHIALAAGFEEWIRAEPNFELMAPRPFSTVCFRAHPRGVPAEDLDAINAELMLRVNQSGEAFISHTVLDGSFVLRLAIGHMWTETRHVERVQALLIEGLESLQS